MSCKNQDKKIAVEEPKPASKDSLTSQNEERKTIYIERGRLDLKDYFIIVKSQFTIPDSLKYDSSFYFDDHILMITDKKNNTADSLALEGDFYYRDDIKIEDYSDSLHFKTLLLYITWTGSSDIEQAIFTEYNNQSLKVLFSVESLVTLARKDEWTLTGFVSGRDELVYSGQQDYPVTISLKDYEVKITEPNIQYIGYPTFALAGFKAYRDRNLKQSSAYTIKKGKKLTVDTLYRAANLVRLIVADTIILYARPDKIKEHIQGNTAG